VIRLAAAAAILLASAALAGCGGVVSENPASDDATSAVDARITGLWRIDAEESGGSDLRKDAVFAVGRKPDAAARMRYAWIANDADTGPKASGGDLLATEIGGLRYLSTRDDPEADAEPSKKRNWWILRYDLPDGDTLRLRPMDEDAVARDVGEGKIQGEVSEVSPAKEGRPASHLVALSATTTALRAYLEARGETIFRTGKPLVLRRLRLP
jgi:hypothetical protein